MIHYEIVRSKEKQNCIEDLWENVHIIKSRKQLVNFIRYCLMQMKGLGKTRTVYFSTKMIER